MEVSRTEQARYIREGKIRTWSVGSSFIEVWYRRESLPSGWLVVYRFTTHRQELESVRLENPSWLPIPTAAKKHRPLITSMMEELLKTLAAT